ncbi:unnamed protein product [Symbiodinium sp. CCMP2592]|nr:unnamed protein product [Symbiodinium sp. CCMP2592]
MMLPWTVLIASIVSSASLAPAPEECGDSLPTMRGFDFDFTATFFELDEAFDLPPNVTAEEMASSLVPVPPTSGIFNTTPRVKARNVTGTFGMPRQEDTFAVFPGQSFYIRWSEDSWNEEDSDRPPLGFTSLACGFRSSYNVGVKNSFECTEYLFNYTLVLDITHFAPNACEPQRMEFIGVRSAADAPAGFTFDLSTFPLPVLLFDRRREAMLGTAVRRPSLLQEASAQPGYYGTRSRYSRYGRKWLPWRAHSYFRKRRDATPGQQATSTPAPSDVCARPRLNGLTLPMTGVASQPTQTLNVVGLAKFTEYDQSGSISDGGPFVLIVAELNNSDDSSLPVQRQIFHCASLNSGTVLCTNQFLNVLGRVNFGALGRDCVPEQVQLFGLYRFLEETAFGPVYFESPDFPKDLSGKCNGAYPNLVQLQCYLKADAFYGGFGGFLTQEILSVEFQGDLDGTPRVGGRQVRFRVWTNETAVCTFETVDTLACLFENTCTNIRVKVDLDDQCNGVSFGFLGSSGGWCSGVRVEGPNGPAYRFYVPPPTAYNWNGYCLPAEGKSAFEVYNCDCVPYGYPGFEFECAFQFMTLERYIELGVPWCVALLGESPSECEGTLEIFAYAVNYAFSFGGDPIIPTWWTCDAVRKAAIQKFLDIP